MRKAAVFAGAMAMCAGCSGNGLPSATAVSRAAPAVEAPDLRVVEHGLFISNLGNSVTLLRGNPYHEVRQITRGVHGSDGLWVDRHGNLYVSNINTRNVTEYLRGGGLPACRYSAELVDPIDVTTDDKGNVYVIDFNDMRQRGFIDEYPHCQNKVIARYEVTYGPEGVAVDSAGDVFVAYYNGAFGGFEEFVKGKGKPRALEALVTQPGGIVLDHRDDLIADDQSGSIDVIPPPYKNPKLFVTGLYDPFRLALDKSETRLYSANSGSANVTIYSYPSADLLETVSSKSITAVEGVGVSPDAAF